MRIVSDKNGDYDLALVVGVTKIPRKDHSVAPPVDMPPLACLHYPGTAQATQLDYAETRATWLAVKAAESHPVDGTNDEPTPEREPS